MYSAYAISLDQLIRHVVNVIQEERNVTMVVAIRMEIASETEADKKEYYKTYDRNNEDDRTEHRLRLVLTLYVAPNFKSLFCIHMISAFFF